LHARIPALQSVHVGARLSGPRTALVSNLLLRPSSLNCPDTLRKVEHGYLSY
jgi:hypothetical protein